MCASAGKRKILFLTNAQADVIASSPEGVQKMLAALEIPKPSLVINLLKSCGFRDFVNLFAPEKFKSTCLNYQAGMVGGAPPFLSREDELAAEARIDEFMSDVIIPLAAQTK